MVKKKVKKNTKKKKQNSEYRPAYEYYNMNTGEIYPKIFFRETWFEKFLKFLRFKKRQS